MTDCLDGLRGFLERRISLILIITMGGDLAFQVVQTAIIYQSESSRFYFEAFTVLMLMISTLYFAYNSLVKENAFELLSFLVFSSILNFHGIYISASRIEIAAVSYIGYTVQGLTQLTYFVSYYFAYQTFGWRMISETQTTNMVLLSAFKMYETFVSVLKVDFILCLFMYATYIYYILVDWVEVAYEYCGIATVILIAFIAYFILGMIAIHKEHKPAFVLFLIFVPVCEALKLYFAATILLAPGRSLERFLLIQFLVICAADLMAALLLLALGVLLLNSFSQGLKTLLERVGRRGVTKPLI